MRKIFDIAVIGGGVVGLAILRRLALSGLSCVLLERGSDILSGASKGNSALLHTGFDAPPESLELACIQAGYREYLDIRQPLNLPLIESSALVVAWTEEELAALPKIVAKAHGNRVSEVREIGSTALLAQEPFLAPALGAVRVPGEHIIDPWSAPLAYGLQAIAHGAMILRNAEVTSGANKNGVWTLKSAQGDVQARAVINAAGNFGDLVEAMARVSPFRIRPRKGQFVVFDKPAAALVNAIILPVPTERTKGVVLFRTAFGNLAIGPTAEDQEDRETAACDHATLVRLTDLAIAMVPQLIDVGVNAIYAGLRPASDQKDYIIEALPERSWITVGGIRSTGLTAALGIARHVAVLARDRLGIKLREDIQPVWTPVPNLSEYQPRPHEQGGEIICHCEAVTRGEIAAALDGPLPALDLQGLKRRTRATMGRCQGFYCSAQVAAMLREKRHGTA